MINRQAVRLAALTGIEPAEAAALRWGDVDWLRGRLVLTVRLADGPTLALEAVDPQRAVPIDWETLRLLERQHGVVVGLGGGGGGGGGDGPARFVFPDLDACPLGSVPLGLGGHVWRARARGIR